MASYIATGSGIAARNGTASHTINFGFTSAAGSLLVFVVYGSVTHAATGWTEQLSPVNSGELSVFTKVSAGDSSITVTHNASDYPVVWQVFEFLPQSEYSAGYGENTLSDTWPALSSLSPDIPKFIIGARGRSSNNVADTAASSVWAPPWVEASDAVVADDGVTDGGYLTVGYQADVTATSATPDATTTYSWSAGDRQHAVFAVQAMTDNVASTFTGTNGDPWPVPWSAVDGTNEIVSNRGQQITPTGNFNRAEMRANAFLTDVRVDATVRFSQTGNVSERITLRWDTVNGTGYRLILPTDYDGMQIVLFTAHIETPVVEEFTTNWAPDTDYRVAFEAVGTTLRAKRWLVGDPEPGSWLISGTDATFTGGDVTLITSNGASGGAVTGAWDDVTVAGRQHGTAIAAGVAGATTVADVVSDGAAGTAAGVAGASTAAVLERVAAGAAAGIAGASTAAVLERVAAGAAAGIAGASTAAVLERIAAGTAAGVAGASTAAVLERVAAGAAAGIAGASTVADVVGDAATGTAAGVAGASTTAHLERVAAGTAGGVTDATTTAYADRIAAATCEGTAGGSTSGFVSRFAVASAAGVAGASTSATVTGPITGVSGRPRIQTVTASRRISTTTA